MQYRKYGKTNEMVSALGFGCMRLPLLAGGDPSQIDEDLGIRMVRQAIDGGVNYIDTAYPYHGLGRATGGASEPFVAKALKDGYRERVKIATKLPSWLIQTREDMDRYLNEQLARLETDTIDFYLVHNINKQVWETLKANDISGFLDTAVQDGRIRHAGFSFHDKLPLFKDVVDHYDWSFCQIQFNYLDEDYQAGKEGLDYAAARGLGISVMEPLRGGKLAGVLPDQVQGLFDQAEERHSPAAWALKWVWNHPEVSVVLSGMSTLEQVTENLKTADEAGAGSLSVQETAMIDEAKVAFKDLIKVNCTACGYCMPCPVGVDIPTCFAMYNNHAMFGREEGYTLWLTAQQRASCCIGCRQCESHCPQDIVISEVMQDVRRAME